MSSGSSAATRLRDPASASASARPVASPRMVVHVTSKHEWRSYEMRKMMIVVSTRIRKGARKMRKHESPSLRLRCSVILNHHRTLGGKPNVHVNDSSSSQREVINTHQREIANDSNVPPCPRWAVREARIAPPLSALRGLPQRPKAPRLHHGRRANQRARHTRWRGRQRWEPS